jgi:hypothetical protein
MAVGGVGGWRLWVGGDGTHTQRRHGRTARHTYLAAPGLCIDKATRNALHGSGSGSIKRGCGLSTEHDQDSLARPRARQCFCPFVLRSAKKLGRRRWAPGARKKPYGKKWLWPAQDPQETHRRPRCPDFLMVHPYCTSPFTSLRSLDRPSWWPVHLLPSFSLRRPLFVGARLACAPLGAASSRFALCVSAEGSPSPVSHPARFRLRVLKKRKKRVRMASPRSVPAEVAPVLAARSYLSPRLQRGHRHARAQACAARGWRLGSHCATRSGPPHLVLHFLADSSAGPWPKATGSAWSGRQPTGSA